MSKANNEVFELAIRAEKPVLYITGEVNREMYVRVADALAFLTAKGSPALDIRIDSAGGSVKAGLDIFDVIRLYGGVTVGTVHSKAESMAAIILQACATRRCARHAKVLIHHVITGSVRFDTLVDTEALKRLTEDMVAEQKPLYDILANRTGRTEQEIADRCKLNKSMSATEALDFKLIDVVI